MIAINELRVGNYAIRPNGMIAEIALCDFALESDKMSDFEKWNPILLTEEWLFKFGFIETYRYLENKDGLRRMAHKKTELFTTVINSSKEKVINARGFSFDSSPKELVQLVELKYKIEYVHQFQNLHFALTGKELTIKQIA